MVPFAGRRNLVRDADPFDELPHVGRGVALGRESAAVSVMLGVHAQRAILRLEKSSLHAGERKRFAIARQMALHPARDVWAPSGAGRRIGTEVQQHPVLEAGVRKRY